MSSMIAYFILRTPEDTQALAARVSQAIQWPMVIALQGNLGSGKTTFTQYLARSLGGQDFLPSPTFTLVNEHQLDATHTLVHADLYRLHSQNEMQELGLSDYFVQPNTLTLVEWADRLPELFPPQTLWITFDTTGKERVATLASSDPQFWLLFHFDTKATA